jgi:hypothetical protein
VKRGGKLIDHLQAAILDIATARDDLAKAYAWHRVHVGGPKMPSSPRTLVEEVDQDLAFISFGIERIIEQLRDQ